MSRPQITAQPSINSGEKPRAGHGRPKRSQVSARQARTQFKPGNPWAFKPGTSGNPGGRPRLVSLALLELLALANEHGVTNAAIVALALLNAAVKGSVPAIREIRRATEGDKFKFDMSQLSDEQLERLANGEAPAVVLGMSLALGQIRSDDHEVDEDDEDTPASTAGRGR